MHYVNQVGLSRSNRYLLLGKACREKATESFWVMLNLETSLNTLMNELQISKNCKSAHLTMICVTKVLKTCL